MGVTVPLYVLVVVVSLAALGCLLGGLLWRIGSRGRRVDDHPLCRRCGFDLTGRPTTSDRCAECGADLAVPRAIISGHRRPRPWLRGVGVGVVLLSLAWAIVGVGSLARNVDWQAAKPAWWLFHDARSDVRATREAALDQLAARAEHNPAFGTVARLDADDERAFIERVLEIQADPSLPWRGAWADVVARRIADGTLPTDQRDAFLAHALGTPTLSVRADVRVGDGLPMVTRFAHRGSQRGTLVVRFDDLDEEAWVDGVQVRPPARTSGAASGGSNSSTLSGGTSATSAWIEAKHLRPIAPGIHRVERRTVARIRAGFGDDAREIAAIPIAAASTFTLHPAGTPLLRWIDDESMRPAVEALLRGAVRMEARGGRRPFVVIDTSMVMPPPAPLAFRVSLRQGGRTWPVGDYATNATRYHWSHGRDFPGLQPGVAEVVFTPEESAAAGTVDVVSAWRGEVVLRDVAVP